MGAGGGLGAWVHVRNTWASDGAPRVCRATTYRSRLRRLICLFLGLAEPTPATISRTVSGRFGNGRTTSSEGVLGRVGYGKGDVNSRALCQGTAPLGMPSAPHCTHLGCGWSVKSVSISSARPSMVFCLSRAADRVGQRHAVAAAEARVSSQVHGDAGIIAAGWQVLLPQPRCSTQYCSTTRLHAHAPTHEALACASHSPAYP